LSANDYDYVAQLADELFASLSGTTVLSQEVPFANWIRDSVADIKSGRILSLAPAERDRLIQSPTHIPELCIAAADLVMGRAFSESWLNDVLKAAVHAKQADRMQLDSAESERVLSLGLVPVHVSRRAKEMLTGILIINRIQKECAQRCEEIRCPERKQQAMREVFERISEELLLGDKLTSDDFVDPFSKRGWLILKKDWLRSHAETVLIWYRETHVTRTSTMHTLPQKPR
jgi:hypothetical protein